MLFSGQKINRSLLELRKQLMANPQGVLIIQIASTGMFGLSSTFENAAREGAPKMTRDKDFLAFCTAQNIKEWVFEDDPQLLITGIVSDNIEDVPRLVEELRKKNPQLVVVTYSSCNIQGTCFDRQIHKFRDGAALQLTQAITDFREGKLRRKTS